MLNESSFHWVHLAKARIQQIALGFAWTTLQPLSLSEWRGKNRTTLLNCRLELQFQNNSILMPEVS